jgi:hypothetical protein
MLAVRYSYRRIGAVSVHRPEEALEWWPSLWVGSGFGHYWNVDRGEGTGCFPWHWEKCWEKYQKDGYMFHGCDSVAQEKICGKIKIVLDSLEGIKYYIPMSKSTISTFKLKVAVLGMRERGGNTLAMLIETTSAKEIQGAIHARVEIGSTLMTDEHAAYNGMGGLFFQQERVNHSAGEYVRGMAHTNGIESVWAVLKRGLNGVYHHVTAKHLGRYVDEFTFRLNEGNVARHTLERLASFVDAVAGKRITYKELTA